MRHHARKRRVAAAVYCTRTPPTLRTYMALAVNPHLEGPLPWVTLSGIPSVIISAIPILREALARQLCCLFLWRLDEQSSAILESLQCEGCFSRGRFQGGSQLKWEHHLSPNLHLALDVCGGWPWVMTGAASVDRPRPWYA